MSIDSSSNILYIILVIGGILIVGLIGKRAGWFKIISGTNQLLREQNQELRNQNIFLKGQLENDKHQHNLDKKDWAVRHSESLTEIAKLQGKVDTLTAIPLKAIDESLKELLKSTKDNVESNKGILEQLKSTAHIAAEDRDVLTNQNVHKEIEKIGA